ncbi:MAG TPA: hypothetical protein ENJ60_10525 [Aeromonadales bacterium]|nr:hypothetical protein [Aeromonadales bacterium]
MTQDGFMINGIPVNQVYLVSSVTDMRKATQGLSLFVSEQLEMAVTLFFVIAKGDNLKILYWERNGFWLYYRTQEKGKFQWPSEKDPQTLSLTLREKQ